MKNKGITLVALVITIIVLLILSGVTISALSGENGIITNAIKAKKMTTLSQCKEEYEMFITEEMIKNNKFQKTSLAAGETNLIYNTQKPDETGNIYNVIPSLKNNEYSKKIEIIKGDLLLNTKDTKEIELAQSVGIQANPYDIVNGELLSSNGNLLLMDETGTVTIPDRVTKIGDGAFRGVDGLKTIIIPGTVKEIGDHAFSGNTTLENVIMNEGIEKIGRYAFQDCKSLKKIKIADSVNFIESGCFANDILLSDVNIPKSLKRIPMRMFSNCPSIINLNIPEGIIEIEWASFEFADGIKTINIPTSATKIHGGAFALTRNLEKIEIDIKNEYFTFENGMLMSKNKDKLYTVLYKQTSLEIPKSVKIIDSDALISNNKIANIFIPENVERIDSAFSTAVKKIDVSIDNNFFKSVDGNLYDKSGKILIKYCANESIVNLIEGLETVKIRAFYGQNNIKNIKFPESTKNIEGFIFSASVSNIYLGKNVSGLSTNIFYNADANIEISKDNPYYKSDDGTLILSKDGKELCAVTKNLSNYNIPNTVEVLKQNVFYAQSNLKEINLNKGIKRIETDAFDMASSLTRVELPSTIEEIQDGAFSRCNSLKEIIVDKPKDSILGSPWGAPFGLRTIKWLK